jgi:hypothetical protein
MDTQARQDVWLFDTHSKAQLKSWAHRLSHFRFCRAHGGQANDGDVLQVALRIDSEQDLLELFSKLGIPVRRVSENVAQPIPYIAYPLNEFAKFPTLIPQYKTLEQPGRVTLSVHEVYAWVDPGNPERLNLKLPPEDTIEGVTTSIVESAAYIEALLQPFADKILDPPIDSWRCICPKWHPEFWLNC